MQVRIWKQTPNVDRECSGMNECWGNEWVVSANDRDGSIRTRQVPVKVKRGLSLHARRPQQRTPPSIDRAAKSTWFNEARGPHPPWPIFNSFFFAVLNSNVIDSFLCLPYLRGSLLEPAGLLNTEYVRLYQSFFGARIFAKGKSSKLDSTSVWKSHTHLFSD